MTTKPKTETTTQAHTPEPATPIPCVACRNEVLPQHLSEWGFCENCREGIVPCQECATLKRQRDRLLETAKALLSGIKAMASRVSGVSVKDEAGLIGLIKRSSAAIADCVGEK